MPVASRSSCDIEAAIRSTLDRMDTTTFQRESNDCDAIIADYVQMVTGRDPMAKWRGQYATDEDAEKLIAEAGGNAALVREGMASIGLHPKPLDEVKRGDVVIIDFLGDEIFGLFLDPFTACKSKNGRLMTRRPVMEAWSCG